MILSDHFKRTAKLLALVAALLAGAYFWLRHRVHDVLVPPRITLPKDDRELIKYDENRHIVTVTTATGTKREYSRSPSIEIRKDGTVKVDANTWGSEVRPFLGPGYSDTGRIYLGCDLFYYRQFDLGASFGWTADGNRPAFQPMLSVGWNFWSSTSLNVGANPAAVVLQQKPEIAVFISVRL